MAALFLVLLAAPIVGFLGRGWRLRKESILSQFDSDAAQQYFETFHGAPSPPEGDPKKGDQSAKRELEKYYDKRFSRLLYICPAILLLATAVGFLIPAATSLSTWLQTRNLDGAPLPIVVILAFMGGYVWVLYDSITQSSNGSVRPQDLYWYAFRLLISIPVGYSIGLLATESIRLPVAFCLGAIPAWTLRSLFRRIAVRAANSEDAAHNTVTELISLPGIDMDIAQSLSDENITTIQQLATCDPVDLTIRLRQPFSYVVGIMSDAILWYYLGSRQNLESFRLRGICGAYDCALLNVDLDNAENLQYQKAATDVVADLATALNVKEAGIRTLIWNVAHDPNTRFLFSVWGAIE